MHALKHWFDRSLLAQSVFVLVLGVGIAALFHRGDNPVSWVVQGVFYGAVVMGTLAFQRRRAARAAGTDAQGVTELHRKIRHREVPEEPEERAAMRRLVAEQLGTMERAGRWLPYSLGFLGLIAVGLVVLGVVGGSLTFPLIFAVALIGFCYWCFWMRRRSLGLYHHMRAELQGHT
ncbi:hypothetical protein OG521_38255 [Streptomyces sp. NBC_01463]|uniref:hypothetical protein n=1 Tax=unclassified Streptomyces TaxID=2593676 RepID=UPI002554DE16|nr:hypothetical protein [Streptomyces sp. RTGN2]WSU56601.1 hypothetical protein OG450_01535 [Streptomyces sp. NBC_01104]